MALSAEGLAAVGLRQQLSLERLRASGVQGLVEVVWRALELPAWLLWALTLADLLSAAGPVLALPGTDCISGSGLEWPLLYSIEGPACWGLLGPEEPVEFWGWPEVAVVCPYLTLLACCSS
jgi:hypothetical protein